jgi:hypothetical protein
MGEMKKCSKFWLHSLKGRDHSEHQGIDGKVIPVVDSCERSYEPLGSINGREFLDYVHDCQFLKRE